MLVFGDEFIFFLFTHTCRRKVLLHFLPFLLQLVLLLAASVSETLGGWCDRNRTEHGLCVFD